MSEMRAPRNPVSSKTRLAASTSRARVSVPLRERGAIASAASADRDALTARMASLESRALERQALRVGGDLVELAGDELRCDVGLVRERAQRVEIESVELRGALA